MSQGGVPELTIAQRKRGRVVKLFVNTLKYYIKKKKKFKKKYNYVFLSLKLRIIFSFNSSASAIVVYLRIGNDEGSIRLADFQYNTAEWLLNHNKVTLKQFFL